MGLFSTKKSNATTTNTSTTYTDARQVNDAGGGAVGTGNTVITTDGGAFDLVKTVAVAQTDAARQIADVAAGSADSALTFASKAQEGAAGFNLAALGKVFDLASSSTSAAFSSSREAMGAARDTFDTAATLTKVAADTASGNRTLIYAGLAVVGLAAAFFVFRKG